MDAEFESLLKTLKESQIPQDQIELVQKLLAVAEQSKINIQLGYGTYALLKTIIALYGSGVDTRTWTS